MHRSGEVQYLDQADATTQRLAYINEAGNAVLKVDNTSNVLPGGNRNSVGTSHAIVLKYPYQFASKIRITSQDYYSLGSLWIIDAVHIPYGCSVRRTFYPV